MASVTRKGTQGKSPDQLRRERAHVEYAETTFDLQTWRTSAGPKSVVYVHSPNGNCYTVTDSGRCSCPDFQRRGSRCKHLIGVELFLSNGTREADPTPKPAFDIEQEARTQAALRDRELLWGPA
jgi:predicted nucleic acid-binding Zn finger protein